MYSLLKRTIAPLLTLAFALTALAGVANANGAGQGDSPSAANFSVPLPSSSTTTTAGNAWVIQNNGSGRAGLYISNYPTTTLPTLEGISNSKSAGAFAVMGVMAQAAPGSGSAGVYGYNSATSGQGYGVEGVHHSSGTGVYGAAGAFGKGVYGTSPYIGVEGYNARYAVVGSGAATASTYGGWFTSRSTSLGIGVYGTGQSGVYGLGGPHGYGGYF